MQAVVDYYAQPSRPRLSVGKLIEMSERPVLVCGSKSIQGYFSAIDTHHLVSVKMCHEIIGDDLAVLIRLNHINPVEPRHRGAVIALMGKLKKLVRVLFVELHKSVLCGTLDKAELVQWLEVLAESPHRDRYLFNNDYCEQFGSSYQELLNGYS